MIQTATEDEFETCPLVSIITVNYNGIEDTLDLLHSIEHTNTYANHEVIVVDNNSKVDPTDAIKRRNADVIVIRSEENLGFAGGNNLGIREAKGDFLLFVNNDTIFTKDFLSHLLKPFYQNRKIGGISPKIMFFDQPDLIQFAGFTKINKLTGRNKTIGEKKVDVGQFNQSMEIPYLHGAAMLIRRCVLGQVGEMPEDYFLYYEEMDWSERIRKAGYILMYEPSAVIYHKESASVAKISDLKLFYQTRNRLVFVKRNHSRIHRFIFSAYFFFIGFPLKSIQYLIKGDTHSMGVMLDGVKDYFKHPKRS